MKPPVRLNPLAAWWRRRDWVGVVVALSVPAAAAAQTTNNPPSPAPTSELRRLNFDEVTVQGVRVSPGAGSYAGGGGQGPGSLDTPGVALPMSVASPAGGASSNKNEWVAAPLPSLNPTFGFGLALGAGYLYRPAWAGTNSPPWVTGAGGYYAQNGSWAAGAAHKMNWDEDHWRLLGGLAYADLRYDFFGVGAGAGEAGQSVPLRQTAGGGLIELLRGVGQHWYVGGRYVLARVQTSVETSDLNIPPSLAGLPLRLDTQLAAFSLRLQRDTRDSTFYPTRGTLFDVDASFFAPAVGSDYTFQNYAVAYNHYFTLATNQVLAVRGYGQVTSGDAPFFALASFGSGADLRGYTPGRYRDKMMFAVQAEYRWRFTQRFGLVAFGGVGSVAPDLSHFEQVLPSLGAGLRYVVAKKNQVSLRFDVAWGRDEHTFYLGIGEAF